MYANLILAGSFAVGDGYRAVNSELVNEVAKIWAKWERGIKNIAKEGSQIMFDVPPL